MRRRRGLPDDSGPVNRLHFALRVAATAWCLLTGLQPEEEERELPLSVVVRDAISGRPVSGATVLLEPAGLRGLLGESDRRPLRELGGRHVLSPSPIRRGGEDWAVRVAPPKGFAIIDGEVTITPAALAPFSEAIEATYLIWPEARVRVAVIDADGAPVEDATLVRATLAGQPLSASLAPTPSKGEFDLRGVPCLRDEQLKLIVGRGLHFASASLRLQSDPPSSVLRILLPREQGLPPIEEGVMVEKRGPRHSGIVLGATGAVRVRVLREGGRPAPGVRVFLGVASQPTDEKGTVLFEKVAVGVREVIALEPGFQAGPSSVEVREGKESSIELATSAGTVEEVVVVDDRSRPVAGARIDAVTSQRVAYARLSGVTHQLPLFTDPEGRVTLTGVPAASLEVRARLGSRSVKGTLEPGKPLLLRLPPTTP